MTILITAFLIIFNIFICITIIDRVNVQIDKVHNFRGLIVLPAIIKKLDYLSETKQKLNIDITSYLNGKNSFNKMLWSRKNLTLQDWYTKEEYEWLITMPEIKSN